MQVTAAFAPRNGNPGIVPPHLTTPLPEPVVAAPAAPSAPPVSTFSGRVVLVPARLVREMRERPAARGGSEQAAAEQAVRGAQEFFRGLGVSDRHGNDNEIDVMIEPRFSNAGFIAGDDARKMGVGNGRDLMIVGNSPATGESFAFDKDVVRHEYSHRIVDSMLDLGHEGEQGAMHESLADTFAAAMDDDWTIGEASTPGGMRDMLNPERFGDPGHVREFVRTSKDKGGVHSNNGIPNKAAALIGEQLGRPAMAQIYIDAMANHMTSRSGIVDTAKATLLAAADRFGKSSQELGAVQQAWDAVGVLDILKRKR